MEGFGVASYEAFAGESFGVEAAVGQVFDFLVGCLEGCFDLFDDSFGHWSSFIAMLW